MFPSIPRSFVCHRAVSSFSCVRYLVLSQQPATVTKVIPLIKHFTQSVFKESEAHAHLLRLTATALRDSADIHFRIKLTKVWYVRGVSV